MDDEEEEEFDDQQIEGDKNEREKTSETMISTTMSDRDRLRTKNKRL